MPSREMVSERDAVTTIVSVSTASVSGASALSCAKAGWAAKIGQDARRAALRRALEVMVFSYVRFARDRRRRLRAAPWVRFVSGSAV